MSALCHLSQAQGAAATPSVPESQPRARSFASVPAHTGRQRLKTLKQPYPRRLLTEGHGSGCPGPNVDARHKPKRGRITQTSLRSTNVDPVVSEQVSPGLCLNRQSLGILRRASASPKRLTTSPSSEVGGQYAGRPAPSRPDLLKTPGFGDFHVMPALEKEKPHPNYRVGSIFTTPDRG